VRQLMSFMAIAVTLIGSSGCSVCFSLSPCNWHWICPCARSQRVNNCVPCEVGSLRPRRAARLGYGYGYGGMVDPMSCGCEAPTCGCGSSLPMGIDPSQPGGGQIMMPDPNAPYIPGTSPSIGPSGSQMLPPIGSPSQFPGNTQYYPGGTVAPGGSLAPSAIMMP
jgi:hypothetical protein